MPSIEEKAIFRQVIYIKDKFKGVREETESVISRLQNCLEIFDHRVVELVECNGDQFLSFYRKLNNDFEEFREKLIYIQASVELPSDCELSSQKLSENANKFSNEGKNEPSELISDNFHSKSPVSQPSSSALPDNSSNDNLVATCKSSNSITLSDFSLKSSSCVSVNDREEAVLEQTLSISPESTTLPYLQESSNSVSNASVEVCADSPSLNVHAKPFLPSAPNSYTSLENIDYCGRQAKVECSTSSADQSAIAERGQRELSGCRVMSGESLSQSSCYRSLSSSLSDVCYQSASSGWETASNYPPSTSLKPDESQNSGQRIFSNVIINSIQIDLPMTTTATLTHIENPGNFWMQLDNLKSTLSFPKKKYAKSDIPVHVNIGGFFLAPSKSMPFYLRVRVLALEQNDANVNVLLIDHGSTQIVSKQELRILPKEAYNVPMQAINCFLTNISAPNNIWCFAAIRKLKEFTENSVEAHIKSHIDHKYGVQLVATISMFDEQFSCDIGESLCNDGFAIEKETYIESNDRNSAPELCASTFSTTIQMNNQMSSDSGVSVTSNQGSSPTGLTHESSDALISDKTDQLSSTLDANYSHIREDSTFQTATSENNEESKAADLISFESSEEMQNDAPKSMQAGYNKCLKTCTCECPLHCIVPFPSIRFVEEDFVLVIVSHIVDPSEFYVHMATESSNNLDELLEQMTLTYNSPETLGTFSILLEDLRTGMFCAAWFDDENWYRVKVLEINLNFDQCQNVLVQYVDYGNKAWIKNADLRILLPEFAGTPAFSMKCSLAGVAPSQSLGDSNANSVLWSEEAIKVFKSLIVYESCLTAQICDRTTILSDDPLQILLWDTHAKEDFLINEAFVDSGLAKFDTKLLNQTKPKNDIEILQHWNPMAEEFFDVQNSYGVNFDHFQVAFDGYKHKDEEYLCKYYSLRGYCPRRNCPFEHVPLAEGGVTRDKDELISFNNVPPLPADETYVLMQVCAIYSPSHFYVQLPFGSMPVDELDSLINRGVPRESLQSQEVNALFNELNNHYTCKPFDETTTVALSLGAIVVAKRGYDQTWHRARIIEVEDVTGPAKVFFVDFGNQELIKRRDIRRILPEFLHTPFQAIECCLFDVEPLGFELGHSWSTNSVSCFKNLVSETVMLGHVAYKYNDVLQVSLRRTTQNDHRTVREHLVREGFGQEKPLVISKKPVCKYIPG